MTQVTHKAYSRAYTTICPTSRSVCVPVVSNSYQSIDLRTDKRGNRVLIGIDVLTIFLYLFCFVFYRGINKRREKTWKKMSPEVRVALFISRRVAEKKIVTATAGISRQEQRRGKQEVELPFRVLGTLLRMLPTTPSCIARLL